MTDFEVHAAGLQALEGLQATSFRWNGADYPCLRGGARRAKNLGAGGFAPEADLVLVVRAAVFDSEAARPQLEKQITCEGKNYVVQEIVTPAGTPFLKLICRDPNRNLGALR